MNKEIPSKFVWTRMNTDAGEPLENIVRRKNLERETGEGEFANTFWWGVGENKGPAVWKHLADCEPEVLFSKSRNGARKPKPKKRFFYTTWRVYDSRRRDYGGKWRSIPDNVIVQSDKNKCFAIVCRSGQPLYLSEGEMLDASRMKNLNNDGKKGKTLERSQQAICVVEYSQDAGSPGSSYAVNLRADLVLPRFVRLGGKKRLSGSQCRLLDELGNEGKTVDDYRDVVRKIRG